MPMSSVFVDRLQSSRPAGPQRRYCVGAGLYHRCGHKSDRWPPTSPTPSRSDREALGAQRFLPQLCAWSFGTSWPRYHRPLLPSPGAGQQGLLRWLVSHLCLWRPVYCSGGGVGVFPPGPEVDDFPPWLGVEDFPPWPEADGFPPWFKVDPVLPRSGVGWAPSCHLSEVPVAGVSVRVDFGGRGRPLGQAIGTLGTSCPWRWGTAWSRPCWAILQW